MQLNKQIAPSVYSQIGSAIPEQLRGGVMTPEHQQAAQTVALFMRAFAHGIEVGHLGPTRGLLLLESPRGIGLLNLGTHWDPAEIIDRVHKLGAELEAQRVVGAHGGFGVST